MMISVYLRAVSLVSVIGMLVAWVLFGISSVLTVTFGFVAGVAGVDQYALNGIRRLKERGAIWKRHYVPALAILHFSIPVISLSFFYGSVFGSAVGVLILSTGVVLLAVQYQRSSSLPRALGN